VERSAAWVQRTMDEIEAADAEGRTPRVLYGVNTGFGDNAGRAIFRRASEAAQLSRNLLLSHTVGAGEHLPPDAVRASMLIRANTLAQGYSGVRREVFNTLVAMLNRGVLPAMPAQGSLGASGDLAPLAHLALVLSAPSQAKRRTQVPTAKRTGTARWWTARRRWRRQGFRAWHWARKKVWR